MCTKIIKMKTYHVTAKPELLKVKTTFQLDAFKINDWYLIRGSVVRSNMISVRVLVCVILTVWGGSYARRRSNADWKSSVHFVYKRSDLLNIKIIFINIPPEANIYALFYGNEDPVRNTIPPDRTIYLKKQLIEGNVTLLLQLHKDNRIYSNKSIMYGEIADDDNSSADEDDDQFHTLCLNKKHYLCRIIVDFGWQGQEDKAQKPLKIKCKKYHTRYTCESPDENLPQNTVHQWYQRDENGSSIGTIPSGEGKRTKFTLQIQKFDEKSQILYRTDSRNKNYILDKIFKNNAPYNDYAITRSKGFSENEEVMFFCSDVAHTQIGLIDPSGYRITTYDKSNHSQSFTKADNGSMYGCLHYSTYFEGQTWVVERSVTDIGVLIYNETLNRDNAQSVTTTERSTSTLATTSFTTPRASSAETSQTSKDEDFTIAPAQESTPAGSPHNVTTTKPAGSDEDQQETEQRGLHQPSDKNKYYIAMASAAGAILLISLIYAIVKKCTRKATDPEETLQLETYTSANMIYAELCHRPGNAPASSTTEDTTYAEIIGVIKPRNEYVKQ